MADNVEHLVFDADVTPAMAQLARLKSENTDLWVKAKHSLSMWQKGVKEAKGELEQHLLSIHRNKQAMGEFEGQIKKITEAEKKMREEMRSIGATMKAALQLPPILNQGFGLDPKSGAATNIAAKERAEQLATLNARLMNLSQGFHQLTVPAEGYAKAMERANAQIKILNPNFTVLRDETSKYAGSLASVIVRLSSVNQQLGQHKEQLSLAASAAARGSKEAIPMVMAQTEAVRKLTLQQKLLQHQYTQMIQPSSIWQRVLQNQHMVVTQTAFAVDDFLTQIGTMGLAGGLRGAANNISYVFATVFSPWLAILPAAATALITMTGGLKDFGKVAKDSANDAKNFNDAVREATGEMGALDEIFTKMSKGPLEVTQRLSGAFHALADASGEAKHKIQDYYDLLRKVREESDELEMGTERAREKRELTAFDEAIAMREGEIPETRRLLRLQVEKRLAAQEQLERMRSRRDPRTGALADIDPIVRRAAEVSPEETRLRNQLKLLEEGEIRVGSRKFAGLGALQQARTQLLENQRARRDEAALKEAAGLIDEPMRARLKAAMQAQPGIGNQALMNIVEWDVTNVMGRSPRMGAFRPFAQRMIDTVREDQAKSAMQKAMEAEDPTKPIERERKLLSDQRARLVERRERLELKRGGRELGPRDMKSLREEDIQLRQRDIQLREQLRAAEQLKEDKNGQVTAETLQKLYDLAVRFIAEQRSGSGDRAPKGSVRRNAQN